MIKAAKLAGYVTSQAFEYFSKKIYGIVLYGYIDDDGAYQFERVQGTEEDRSQTRAIQICKKMLSDNAKNARYAVAVYNNLNRTPKNSELERKVNGVTYSGFYVPRSLVVEFIDFEEMPEPMCIGFPNDYDYDVKIYDAEKYHIPRNIRGDTENFILEALFDGIHSHEKGAKFLFKHYTGRPDVEISSYEAQENVFDLENEDLEIGVGGEKLDDQKWHYTGDLPDGYKENALCIHIGVFLCWCIMHDLFNEDINKAATSVKRIYMKRDHGPGTVCSEIFLGALFEDQLNEEGFAFAKSYYDDYMGEFFDVFDLKEDDYIFSMPDTWDTYDKVAPVIQKEFEIWRKEQKE